jgi:hypothetical protein
LESSFLAVSRPILHANIHFLEEIYTFCPRFPSFSAAPLRRAGRVFLFSRGVFLARFAASGKCSAEKRKSNMMKC